MSQENVELHYRAIDTLNRRDFGAFLELMDADVEAISLLAGIEGGYHGHAGILRWWENLLDAFPDFAVEVVEVRDLGDETLMTYRVRGHGSDTDAPFEMPLWQVVRWRRGKSVWWQVFVTETEALEAVGLREWAMSHENVEIVQPAPATRLRAMTLRASVSSAPSKIDSTRAST